MSALHTPTPWFASAQPEGRFDILDGPNLNTATVLCTRYEYSERKDEMHANAAFIVKAVNSHEQLVAALRETLAEAAGGYEQGTGESAEGCDWYQRAGAALAAAEA